MKSLKGFVSVCVVLCMVLLTWGQILAVEKKAPAAPEKQSKANLININTASVDELMKLPRIGEKMARRIVEYRQQNGKFKKVYELLNVEGIGEKTLKGLENKVTI